MFSVSVFEAEFLTLNITSRTTLFPPLSSPYTSSFSICENDHENNDRLCGLGEGIRTSDMTPNQK